MQNSSATAEIAPVRDSPWVVWRHPVSAIALVTVILSIIILAAAFVSSACLPVYSFDLGTLKFHSIRQKERDRPRSSGVMQLENQPALAEI